MTADVGADVTIYLNLMRRELKDELQPLLGLPGSLYESHEERIERYSLTVGYK